ncbi:uncharacterized protein LOC132615405 isoform X2 [Lycium barbarum]|uniref:uncharacterized protein LOC132615405 isoform X2 n=1 Tax=Lycium barbarum TaxID=112863 RepID=UPI00293E9A77|nr:uncharacterized protein LOC132615405 isoform X2 [Lycium barbarum]
MEPDGFEAGAYRAERLRMHGVELDGDPYVVPRSGLMGNSSRTRRSLSPWRGEGPRGVSRRRGELMDSGVMEQSSRRQRSLSPRREEGPLGVSRCRGELMVRDEEFSDRGDIREPQLRRGLMVRNQDFSDRGDIMEPQLRRRGLMVRDEEFSYKGDVMEPQLSRRGLMVRDEEFSRGGNIVQPKLKSPAYQQVDEKPRRHYEASLSRDEMERRYDELVDYENRYEAARTGVDYDYEYDGARSVQGHNSNKDRGGVHHHGLDRHKLLALEDGASRSKECLTTSSGTSKMNYAPMIQDDMHFLGDIHSRSSTKLRQPLYLNEYSENHSYNTLQDYAAGHKELTGYQYDKVSSPRGDNLNYVYPEGRPRDTSDYVHSYERTSLLEQAILPRRLDYHSSKDEHSNSYDERRRRSPQLEHEMEMLGDRVRLKNIESGVIGCDGHPILSVKRNYILDEEKMGHNSGPVVFSSLKRNINRAQDIDYRNEVWDDQDDSGLLSPENFEDDKWFGEAERTYSRDLYDRVAATDGLLSYRGSIDQGQRHLIRPYNPGKKQKVHENPSTLRQYVSIQGNRNYHLTKNIWTRGKYDKQTEASHHVVDELKDRVACAKTELPEDSIEFKQLVHNFFLSYTKKLNQSVATQKRYKEQGKAGGLYCIVCANSQLKEFKDTRSLATHCFMTQRLGLKAKHLGLFKAICVLMGWSSDAPPEGKLWIPVAVPASNALAQKEDLILWPPVVVIHNCSGLVTGLDGEKVTAAVEDFLRGKGFSGARMRVRLAKPGSSSVLLVKFLGIIPGFLDAEKLHNHFMEEERGRKDFGVATSTKGKGIDSRNVKGDEEELLLYGYMGIAEDLDKVDISTKRRSLIKSKKEIHDFLDAPV